MDAIASAPTKRLLALLAALVMTAAACSGSTPADNTAGNTAEGSEASTETEGQEPASDDDTDGGDEGAQSEPEQRTPLFFPTVTDDPLDLDGGAEVTGDAVEVVIADPTASLDPRVREATQPWTTDWTRRTIDVSELQLGIPASDPRDRIPPIDTPAFQPITEAGWLHDQEPGALVRFNDEVRFYPLSILTRHEIVNDRIGDVPVAVTYCPLCNTAITFDARVGGEAHRFGVSGLLRNSDLVMWDQTTLTLWQQLTGEAVVGELAGTQLEVIPTSIVSYGDARRTFPEALSLSTETGFGIAYGSNAYVGYSSSPTPFLFNGEPDPRYPALSRVVGIDLDDEIKAFPFEELSAAGGVVNDQIGEVPVVVWLGGDTVDALDAPEIRNSAVVGTGIAFDRRVDGQVLTFSAVGDDQFVDGETSTTWDLLGVGVDGPLAGHQLEPVRHRNEFWFAWAAFFPEAAVHAS